MRVGIREIELDAPMRLCPAAADFGNGEFEPVGEVDARRIWLVGHGIHDRLTARFDDSGHHKSGLAAGDIDVEVDLGEDRFVNLLEGRTKYLKDRCARLGVLAAHDSENGLALRWSGALIDDRLDLAMSFVNGTRPREQGAKAQSVEFGIAVMTLVNPNGDHRHTIAVSRQRIELARAAVCAIAMRKIATF